MKVVFELPPAQADRLQREATRLGVAPSELARAALADLLAVHDEDFEAVHGECWTGTANSITASPDAVPHVG
jgi:hypothetical protein